MTINFSKKHLIIACSIIAVIIVTLFGYHFYSISQYEKNAKEFKARVSAIQLPMAIILDDYQKNWHSAIWDHKAINQNGYSSYCSDFSTALQWRIEANKNGVNLINTHFNKIKDLMEKMDNPPGKYEKVHEKFMDIYNKLYKVNSQCKFPEGSLQSFSNEINTLLSDIRAEMSETDITIPVESDLAKQYLEEFNNDAEVLKKALKK